MTHASLFSGIGGFDLAAEWAGWTNMFNCEIDGFCRKVLKYHFPNAQQYADIRTTDFTVWRGRIDVLTGGFPCQPFSLAGKRRGTEDDRYLWPEMLRAIREIRPRWVVGENVYGIVSWSNGLVFEYVCADLENEGYEVQPYILPACAVDAPHRRDRVWIIAHRTDAGTESLQCERQDGVHAAGVATDTDSNRCGKRTDKQKSVPECVGTSDAGNGCENRTPPDSDGERCGECQSCGQPGRPQERTGQGGDAERRIPGWGGFPTQSPVCRGNDGVSAELDGITFPAWCRQSIKAYGNAIVPQVVCRIFNTINEYETGKFQSSARVVVERDNGAYITL